ncbi:Plug domain-containing protein [Methylobacterium sp. J-030]|uniref:TonB-dependent receptor plug domain-containing protein n=1 Tax=Methylobacterium sp. J-030 TaxID=2836627 RepID=UPI001FBB0E0F|nr:Plug domain-containing protein [Methylobacterium sp. J-030]MCJ2071765.1 Plug domain-containing protein [Methylobacterium sp. J-030]
MSIHHLRGSAFALAVGLLVSPASIGAGAAEENAVTLEELSVTGQASGPLVPPPAAVQTPVSTSIVPSDPAAPTIVHRFQLPQTSASVTREQIDQTVNVVDTEDAITYFPSLFVRKRNEGDTQPVIETRTWGVNSSARTLVYADDVLISALIANNNTIGAPRWGIVAPEEIKRIDFLYGPFAAAFPGKATGGVLQITTRMPDHFEATLMFRTFIERLSSGASRPRLGGTRSTGPWPGTNVSGHGRNRSSPDGLAPGIHHFEARPRSIARREFWLGSTSRRCRGTSSRRRSYACGRGCRRRRARRSTGRR